ncbi:uncharacterized protein HMPREF1541_10430 [Cyphellophora europaea CBS 101466]|uniref:Uncharacterized protein n=1 Tax=Cyphellophora europaea (strain CBS 101466) TaxID=1220924 RepID=W2S803_CYPE1|nr:uncharacterized protein HMPREF1541_10430 [Cyphellophora europaea CBS 101466]ETN44760.1 hypothetical protein HMPREF1541_10430 [Cyphellophora europaea CBS 101466]
METSKLEIKKTVYLSTSTFRLTYGRSEQSQRS